MNIGYHSDFMDRIIERADKRQERMEKMINKMLDKSEQILNAGKPKPMTNEEWFCSLPTEEKAIWIERIMFIVRYRKEVEDGAYMQTITKKDYIEKWLKQTHNAKE